MPYQCQQTDCEISLSGALFPEARACPMCGSETVFVTVDNYLLPRQSAESSSSLRTHLQIHNIANAIPGAMLLYEIRPDGTDNILFISDQVSEVWGVAKEDALKNAALLWQVVDPEDISEMQASVQKSAMELSFWDHVWRVNINGSVKWLNGRGYPVRSAEGGVIWNTLILDVTDFKKAQNELGKLNTELEARVRRRTRDLAAANEELVRSQLKLLESNEQLKRAIDELKFAEMQLVRSEKMASLGVLTSGMSHELNNPLNYIVGGALGIKNYLLDHFSELDEESEELLEAIDSGVRRIADIVKSLNQFSASSYHNNTICDIHKIIRNCLTVLGNKIYESIGLRLDFTEEDFELVADESKLHQLFVNLLLNSVQAIENKGWISISTRLDAGQIVILIEDDGVGIEEQYMNKIMDPFFTTKDPGVGTGLGLSIAYAIVEEHGGDIAIQSAVGEGTEVKIKLPVGSSHLS